VRSASHPTRERLIETTVAMLDDRDVDQLNVNEVLEISGISKGSMYHHFEDFDDLINVALVRRFSRGVDADLQDLTDIVTRTRTAKQLFAALDHLNEQVQTPKRADFRAERARMLSRAHQHPELREALGAEQARLTSAFADLIREGQARGWIAADIDPIAFGTFIQAFTLGQLINDVAPESMDYREWHRLIHRVVQSLRP
jgi:AcrR family transcriptional regulator